MKIVSINISKNKGTRKDPVKSVEVVTNHGIAGDAHAGDWHRQVSFLAEEAIAAARSAGLDVDTGDFAENFTTRGIDWTQVPVGSRFLIGDSVLVEITQIGKTCHKPCAIYYRAGDCIMPRQGVFARVISGGLVRTDDPVNRADP